MDDTEGNIQTQLKSDHQHSQLSLGHITRIDGQVGRKDGRGQGFELRTDGHGAIRAKDGLLISTEARHQAQDHITDLGETAQRLISAQSHQDSLGALAQQHDALDAEDHNAIASVLKQQNDAIQGSGGETKEGHFPELAEPHLILASPAGIATTTPHSTHIASGEHLALTSGKNTSLSVGQRLVASVKKGMRLFTHKDGIKATAASGDIDLQALKDSINLLAKLNITHTANRITIEAKEEVVINGGGSFTRWNASGITNGTNGSWTTHAAGHAQLGPQSVESLLPEIPAMRQETDQAAPPISI
ncbi:DUF2345 domain-containing protein [Glaciimonas sp. GG7]